MAADFSQSIDVRCKRADCPRVHRCPAKGKLLASVSGLPRELRGTGVTITLPCPHRKAFVRQCADAPRFQTLTPNREARGYQEVAPEPPPEPELDDNIADLDAFITLVAALLKQTAIDVHDRDPEVAEVALAWFMDDECRKPSVAGGITFCWVADVFGLDPEFLRTQLFAWSRERVNSRRKKASPPPEPVLTDEDFVSIEEVAEEVIYDCA